MATITLEPLRWQDEPARITIHQNGSQPEVYFQILSPKPVEALCCKRPVEELPRILPMLAPAHHLAGALAFIVFRAVCGGVSRLWWPTLAMSVSPAATLL